MEVHARLGEKIARTERPNTSISCGSFPIPNHVILAAKDKVWDEGSINSMSVVMLMGCVVQSG